MLTFQKSEDMYTFSDSLLCAAATDLGIFFSVVVSTPEPVTHMFDHQLQFRGHGEEQHMSKYTIINTGEKENGGSAKTLNVCVHSSLCDIDPQV